MAINQQDAEPAFTS